MAEVKPAPSAKSELAKRLFDIIFHAHDSATEGDFKENLIRVGRKYGSWSAILWYLYRVARAQIRENILSAMAKVLAEVTLNYLRERAKAAPRITWINTVDLFLLLFLTKKQRETFLDDMKEEYAEIVEKNNRFVGPLLGGSFYTTNALMSVWGLLSDTSRQRISLLLILICTHPWWSRFPEIAHGLLTAIK